MPDPGIYLVNSTGDAHALAVGRDDGTRDPELFATAIDTHNADGLLAKDRGKTIALTIAHLMATDYIQLDQDDLAASDLEGIVGREPAEYAVEHANTLLDAIEPPDSDSDAGGGGDG